MRHRLSCTVWGHHVDNRLFRAARSPERRCRCGTVYLRNDGSHTRVRHTLFCFLGHHTYARVGDRDGHHEYACVRCGHPLLMDADRDPYAQSTLFPKKVRYLCGLFGHRVCPVANRDGFVEYACRCGHTFLKSAEDLHVIRHPLICVVSGHFVRAVTRRAGYTEYICRHCGHPFFFADPDATT
jgi:DNA-directed RNA polymerase subunit RPC12/RpoP